MIAELALIAISFALGFASESFYNQLLDEYKKATEHHWYDHPFRDD